MPRGLLPRDGVEDRQELAGICASVSESRRSAAGLPPQSRDNEGLYKKMERLTVRFGREKRHLRHRREPANPDPRWHLKTLQIGATSARLSSAEFLRVDRAGTLAVGGSVIVALRPELPGN